jgi:cysteine desulfurase
MSNRRAYLDYNASAPLRPEALACMNEVFSRPGNASSIHFEGRHFRKYIETARRQVAQLVNAEPDGVVFTGSATEAAHLALSPNISAMGTPRPAEVLLIPATEHPCILSGGRFNAEQIEMVPVNSDGLIDVDTLSDILKHHEDHVPYMAIQLANSETGIVQPVAEIAELVRLRGGYTLCDAVQAIGRMPVDIHKLGVDFLIISAHKMGGPQGVGALIKAQSSLSLPAAIGGGGQEKNQRAGTENTAAIAGFGIAATLVAQEVENFSKTVSLRDSIESSLLPICQENGLADRVEVFGADCERVGNTILFSVKGLKAETALIAFDLDGVSVSSGSACSSGKVGSSHVLQAMGVDPELARGAIRVSLGWQSCEEDVRHFARSFGRIAGRLGEMAGTKAA